MDATKYYDVQHYYFGNVGLQGLLMGDPKIGPISYKRSCATKSVKSFSLRTLLFHVSREGMI